jgi:protein-disulfide isomerase
VFKHLPLPFHKDARLAAVASMAAHQQGKFWEYHDVLFQNQKALKKKQLIQYAKDLGLDMPKFKQGLRDSKVNLKVDNDTAACQAVGKPYQKGGTPAFYINGVAISGAQPFAEFQKIIADQIAKGKKLEEKGTPRAEIARKLTKREKDGAYVVRYFFDEIALKTESAGPPRYKVKIETKRNEARGAATSPLTLVHFTDLTDPKSKDATATIKNLEAAFPGKFRVANKAYVNITDNTALQVSEAALAAKAQGKYWEMHDKLLATQGAHTRADLDRYAAELGLDAAKFALAMDKRTYKADIIRDVRDALGVEATTRPLMFINGARVDGADIDDLKWTAGEELKAAEKELKAGTKAEALYEKLTKKATYAKAATGRANTFNLKGAGILGLPNAKIKIVEFSDFQCPYCSTVGTPLKKLVKKYPNQVMVAFKHFPLSFHKEAKLCSQAALAAGEQGKFWEMHDRIFALIENRIPKDEKAKVYPEKIQGFAQALELDMAKFNTDMKSTRIVKQVEADMAEGSSKGVSGTPSVFINGQKLDMKVAKPDSLEPFLVADFGLQVR